jgi:two-component system phosphate regulon sensor histidine kinase PhoR
MRSSFSKILIIFIAIIILPTAFYSIYELSSYKKYEKEIESIYGNQLEAILFSVNQYSEELLNKWADRIDESVKRKKVREKAWLNELMKDYPSVKTAFLYEENQLEVLANNSDSIRAYQRKARNILSNKDDEIEKLIKYYENDYRKLQPVSFSPGHVLVYFIGERNQKSKVIHGMIIDAKRFINQTLGPKIQEISQDKFYISIYSKNRDVLIYNTDRNVKPPEAKFTKDLWLFPGYYAAIEMKEMNISDLIKERSRKNILFIFLVDILLIIGIVLVFKSIRRQIRLAQLKSEFVSNVSHEIRTPLSLIYMYVESLKMGRVRNKEKEKEYLDVLLKETQRLSGILNKILNFSQIEKGKRKYNYEPVNLNEIIGEVSTTYSYHLENKNFDYNVNLAQDLPAVKADREAITDAIVNLIDNSIKYSYERKSIEIKTGLSSGYVYLEVGDHGEGIAEKDLKHIFDQFYRVTSSDLSPKTKGSGLGLSIVKHIMNAHNGDIKVDSKKGKGSRFILYFPLTIDYKKQVSKFK